MTTSTNVDIPERFFAQLWNEGRLEVADELLAVSHVHHLNGHDIAGPEGVKALARGLRTAFPDLRFTVEDQMEAGDKVLVRWAAEGTHRGPFLGVQPSGVHARWTGMDLIRFADGHIVELWGATDTLALARQLGATLSAPTPAA